MKIKAAVVYEKGGPFIIEELDLDGPKENEVLVKIAATGVCHTDEAGRSHGYAQMPVVLGHEGAGIVEKVGPNVKNLAPGDHVVITYAACGTCSNCLAGKPYACPKNGILQMGGKMLDGTSRISKDGKEINNFFGQSSFATYVVAGTPGVIKVDKDADLKLLGALGCGYQTGAGAVMSHMNAQKGGTLAVLGCGPVGFGGLMGGIIAGCKNVIAVGGTPDKLKLALEIGATHVINRKETPDFAEEIKNINSTGADYILDTTGSPEMIAMGFKALATLGHLTLIAITPDITIPTIPMILSSQTISGNTEGCVDPHKFIPELVSYVKDGRFPIERLATYYKLDEIGKAFEDQGSGKAIKPIIMMD